MKKYYKTIKFVFVSATFGLILSSFTSCGKKDVNSPGFEFMPDMYRSPSLEVYSVHTIDGDTLDNAMQPVKGTVARGYLPYAYPNTAEGYDQAGLNLHNPFSSQKEVFEKEGEVLYGKFCVHCHGGTGAGDGKVGGKLPGPPPAYDGALKNLPEGKIFHTLTYGKGTMGSHSSQLTQEERWKLVFYVQKLQGPKESTSDSTKTVAAVTPTVTAKH
ncbi:MAG: cytochrome c [Bacteroidota bacterium]|nr:cytochrome c [Bacteroidota bacterium]MDP3144135.1 cytochrome c [Bacteroidota bacterium]